MTDYETIARQRLYLAVDNRFPLRARRQDSLLERIAYLLGLAAAGALMLGFWWLFAVVVFSF